jgi:signal transduction histidine kinase
MDERMIEQVLINLVKNAIQAVQPTPHRQITLSAGTRDSIPVLTVRDNGEGIPGDQIDSIFIPFYTTRESGSGIGLSFTQQVMKLHNGHVNVVSREGEGSEFQLHFGTIENPIKEPIGSHSEL